MKVKCIALFSTTNNCILPIGVLVTRQLLALVHMLTMMRAQLLQPATEI